MKFYCIADEDTVRGFQLAGIAGEAVVSAPDAGAAIRKAMTRADCGVIILTSRIADFIRPLIEQLRHECEQPLILEITGPEGDSSQHKNLRQLVQEAVGIHIDQEKGN